MSTPAPSKLCQRRGGVYLLVLSVALVVSMIGVTSSYLARVRQSSDTLKEQSIKARTSARSAAEFLLVRLRSNANWRAEHTSGVWTDPAEAVGEAKVSYRLTDADGLLNDDPNDDVTLSVRASVGTATRMLSVELARPSSVGSNLIPNPSFESGIASWYPNTSTLSPETDLVFAGSQSMRVGSRLTPASGAGFPILSVAQTDQTYDVGAMIYSVGAARSFRIEIRAIMSDSTVQCYGDWVIATADKWTPYSSAIETNWVGTPIVVEFLVYTQTGSEDFILDDVSLMQRPEIAIVSGSWRREILP